MKKGDILKSFIGRKMKIRLSDSAITIINEADIYQECL
jgi:hypothetical protein